MKIKIVAVATAISMGVLGGCAKDSDNSGRDNDSFRPELNDNPDVYGPPPDDTEPEIDLNTGFIPAENENSVVYGPPEDMDIDDKPNPEENEDVYIPSDDM